MSILIAITFTEDLNKGARATKGAQEIFKFN